MADHFHKATGADLGKIGRDFLIIAASSILYAAAMVFLDAIDVITGNIIGIGVIFNILFDWPVGLVNMILSVPVLLAGAIFLGKKRFFYTLFTLFTVSSSIDILAALVPAASAQYPWLNIAAAAVLMGVGYGIILIVGGSTGGTSLMALVIKKYIRHLTVGDWIIVQDVVIITLGTVLTREWNSFLYSIVFEILICKVCDLTMYLLTRWQLKRENS